MTAVLTEAGAGEAQDDPERSGSTDDTAQTLAALHEVLDASGLDSDLADLVPKAPPTFSNVQNKYGPAAGGIARWRFIADHMVQMKPGDALSYEDMCLVLGLDYNSPLHMRQVKAAARKAATKMLYERQRVFQPVRGYGYEECKLGQVVEAVHRHQGRALDEIERAAAKVSTVDTSELGHQDRVNVESTKLLIGYQTQVMRTADVRSSRRAQAFARLRTVATPAPPPGLPPGHVVGPPRVDLRSTGHQVAPGPAPDALGIQSAHPEG